MFRRKVGIEERQIPRNTTILINSTELGTINGNVISNNEDNVTHSHKLDTTAPDNESATDSVLNMSRMTVSGTCPQNTAIKAKERSFAQQEHNQ